MSSVVRRRSRRRHRCASADAGLTRALPSQLRFIRRAEHPPQPKNIRTALFSPLPSPLKSAARRRLDWQHQGVSPGEVCARSLTRRVALCTLQLLSALNFVHLISSCSVALASHSPLRVKSLMNSSRVKYKPRANGGRLCEGRGRNPHNSHVLWMNPWRWYSSMCYITPASPASTANVCRRSGLTSMHARYAAEVLAYFYFIIRNFPFFWHRFSETGGGDRGLMKEGRKEGRQGRQGKPRGVGEGEESIGQAHRMSTKRWQKTCHSWSVRSLLGDWGGMRWSFTAPE